MEDGPKHIDAMNPADLHENIDSPHFRPAFGDLTNNENFALESPGQLAKKRKSLGRRVSFIDKDSDAEAAEFAEEGDNNVFLVEKTPVREPNVPKESPKSDMDMSVVSNDSIEVELKDPHSSFSSYDSAEEVENRPSFLLDDMEMTKCVGGIIAPSQNTEDTTMDLTSCIGGILNNIPNYAMSPSSVDTMELTNVVGGILGPLKSKGADSPTAPKVEDVVEDMAAVIKTARIAPDSPSPFLATPTRLNSPMHSEVSFIGDVDQPGSLGFGASPAPPRTEAAEDMDLTTELFNKYIDTSRFNALTMRPTEESPPAKQLYTPQSPAINLVPPTSQTESPTVTIMLPRASLKDFLNETGVRFLDNISSLNRRETTGRPRESEVVSAAKQLFIDGGLSLEGDALDDACVRLAGMLTEIRDDLQKQEEQFNHSPPLAFLQYRDPEERSNVISKLKTLKSIARLYAKQAWYEWRNPVHSALNRDLEKNVQVVSERVAKLIALGQKLDETITNLSPLVDGITSEAEVMRERCDAMATDDVEQVQQLEQLVTAQTEKLSTIDSEMSALVSREEELRASIDRALSKRKELQQNVAMIKQQIDSVPETSPIILEELRSSFKLLQGATGWRLLKIAATELHLQFTRAELGVAFKLSLDSTGKSIVSSVAFDATQCLMYVGQRLDRLSQIDKQLHVVGVQCTVAIPDLIGPDTCVIPIALGFYHQSSRAKFDLLLTLDAERLSYSQFVYFYGAVKEHHVMDIVQLTLMHKYQPIRRLVAAIQEAIDNQ
ncbi:hypothetical protein PSACC_03367 [Paramicrosporidium saccamoebae]|uniref:Spc7 kinetochore protein domain-containing protein n=1 Tax=Paramicrosporidium saccamoebae TaxID=1246581 RepID=A0A2H9TGG7_9FUNG|nr:hypothetical protein PSACC_03367 [Paramicrosporidium saccamoebae]